MGDPGTHNCRKAADRLRQDGAAGRAAELLPWLKQWHNDLDPAYRVGLGDYFANFIDEEARHRGYTGRPSRVAIAREIIVDEPADLIDPYTKAKDSCTSDT